MPTPTDEIYEKYRDKAILEINALGEEIARAANGRVPVLGSGHPLGDVLLLKYRPQPSEVQEGVAFFGRSGQAILKSLQRLHVDPMAVYGTNCLKFADGDEDESRPFLVRELYIVQPKLVVAMGEQAVAFLNSVEFPLADPLEWKPGELLRFEWRQGDFAPEDVTEVAVRFEPAERGTRVSLEHRGWDHIAAAHPARHGYTGDAFVSMIGLRWADLLTAFRSRTAGMGRAAG